MKLNRRSFLVTGVWTAAATVLARQTWAGSDNDHRRNDRAAAGGKIADAIPSKTKAPRVITYQLKDVGAIPNSRLPVVLYQGALILPKDDSAAAIEALIHANGWGNDWRNGIFTYHHYHSTAHEALLVYSGQAKVQLGGEAGPVATLGRGDAIVIPAGVGHKNVGSSRDFHVIGAYPPGQQVDMNYGVAKERPQADENIVRVALPTTDPVLGNAGPLLDHWHAPIKE